MHSCTKGMTLIELLVAMSIGVIALTLSVPFFTNTLPRLQANSHLQELRGVIRYGRVMAVQMGHPVTLCPLGSSDACGQDWSQGYLLTHLDDSGNTTTLRVVKKKQDGHQLNLRAFPHNRHLRFMPYGYQQKQNGSFYYQSDNGKHAWKLVLSRTGRARAA